MLASSGFARLKGKRVGLVANHTTTVGEQHLADMIHAAPDVTLAALFGPEHGIRGTADASEKVPDDRDRKTGVRIYSLYGATRQPTEEMLAGIDILVFDIQDIGARFYTYISTMGLAMQAAASANIPFMVLDRPNPLGGEYVAGHITENEHISFVSQFAIPLVHGMTVGELAALIRGQKLLPGLERLELEIIDMEGWRRAMLWPDTGLSWVATSPNVPDFETALIYPGTGFLEATTVSEGRGTGRPFKQIGAPWLDGDALASELNDRALAGVRFKAARFTPRRLPGMATDAKGQDRELSGVEIKVTDARSYQPVETGVHLLHAIHTQARKKRQKYLDRPDWLAKLSGTRKMNGMLRRGYDASEIISAWQPEVTKFRRIREPYLRYR